MAIDDDSRVDSVHLRAEKRTERTVRTPLAALAHYKTRSASMKRMLKDKGRACASSMRSGCTGRRPAETLNAASQRACGSRYHNSPASRSAEGSRWKERCTSISSI